MALYENVFIARQDVPTTQVEALAKQFTDLVTAQGGTVSKNEYWGLRSLTFRIKKNRKGHYTLLNIDAPPAAVKELERTMSINEDIIRSRQMRWRHRPVSARQRRHRRARRRSRGKPAGVDGAGLSPSPSRQPVPTGAAPIGRGWCRAKYRGSGQRRAEAGSRRLHPSGARPDRLRAAGRPWSGPSCRLACRRPACRRAA